MSIALRIIIDVLLFVGAFFALVGVVGVIRYQDTYCRMQASTCIATLGVMGVILGAIVYAIWVEHNAGTAVKLALLLIFILFTNPISGHALAKGAYKQKTLPRKEMIVDDYGEDNPDD